MLHNMDIEKKKPYWLPDLVLFEDYNNNWDKYVEALYSFYKADFIDNTPIFNFKPLYNSVPVYRKKYPIAKGKDFTFWHLIQEGKIEEDRLPDFERCERIKWPCPIIKNSNYNGIKIWENKRKGDKRICIWFKMVEYLVVLAKRKNYVLLWTAYPVTKKHRKKKLLKEFEEYSIKS